MDLRFPLRSIEVIGRLLNQQPDKINKITYMPQKPLFELLDIASPLPRRTPEQSGIPSSHIEAFFQAIQQLYDCGMHGIMILRHGFVIAEASFSPYNNFIPHICHSLSKSIVSLAVGLAIDEGLIALDDRIIDIFQDEYNILNLNILRMKNLTIEHLLTMSSGVQFNEMGAVTVDNWVRAYLDASFAFEPGSHFQYNSMNTFMLSASIEKRTGYSVTAYLEDRLFAPLGIQLPYWEKSPSQIEKGGWGLSLRIEDMAKIGQLLLQKGYWEGRPLIPASWIDLATSQHIDTPAEMNRYGYGYHFWMCAQPDSFCCNGMLGQNIIILPETEMVIVTTAGRSELFPNSPLVDTIMQYFDNNAAIRTDFLPDNPPAYRSLLNTLNNLKAYDFVSSIPSQSKSQYPFRRYRGGWQGHTSVSNNILPPQARLINGRSYNLDTNYTGILPLCLQCMHNNYSIGIQNVQFYLQEEQFFIAFTEGEQIIELAVGFQHPIENIFTQNDEVYRTAVSGIFTHNEDNHLVLKLEIAFVETSNCRIIKCFFQKNELHIIMDELPHMQDIVNQLETMISANIANDLLTSSMKGVSDLDYAQYRLRRIFVPELYGSCPKMNK